MGSLGNRVAIMTGAGRGIGRSHALLLAAKAPRSSSTIWAAPTPGRVLMRARPSRWLRRSVPPAVPPSPTPTASPSLTLPRDVDRAGGPRIRRPGYRRQQRRHPA